MKRRLEELIADMRRFPTRAVPAGGSVTVRFSSGGFPKAMPMNEAKTGNIAFANLGRYRMYRRQGFPFVFHGVTPAAFVMWVGDRLVFVAWGN